jgi:hypothetical protein
VVEVARLRCCYVAVRTALREAEAELAAKLAANNDPRLADDELGHGPPLWCIAQDVGALARSLATYRAAGEAAARIVAADVAVAS